MTLSAAQEAFAVCVAKLVLWADGEGYGVTFGEAWRSTATARLNAERGVGIAGSLHCDRLAVDLNLFRGGAYLSATEDHAPLGTYWKTLHPLARWGGDFTPKRDGNHYSFEWRGRK